MANPEMEKEKCKTCGGWHSKDSEFAKYSTWHQQLGKVMKHDASKSAAIKAKIQPPKKGNGTPYSDEDWKKWYGHKSNKERTIEREEYEKDNQ